jgi:hypothetical protein
VTVPFEDTGNTCDNVDDYDEICPYGGMAPDVVYTFTPTSDLLVSVDLCGSDYDTKVYLWDADLNLVACNDDYYTGEPCGLYVSFIEDVYLDGGQTYYLVVDGYGNECGDYILAVCEYPPCIGAQCGPDDVLEGEPPLVDGYVDTFNGGCDVDPPVFQELTLPPGGQTLEFCGTTGWYENGGQQRDSDWFLVEASGELIRIEAEGPLFASVDLDVLYLDDCQDVSILPHQMGICLDATIEIPTVPGEVVFLRVRPTSTTRPICASLVEEYTMTITGIGGVVTVESRTWSAVRQLYR